jgi:hypothetical protein
MARPQVGRTEERRVSRVHINGVSYATPFARLFREHTDTEYRELRDSIRDVGVQIKVIVYTSELHGRSVIDGIGRARAASELDLADVPVHDCGKIADDVAEALARHLNKRRHLTPEELKTVRAKELERAAALRKTGMSLRAIAKETNLNLFAIRGEVGDTSRVRTPHLTYDDLFAPDPDTDTDTDLDPAPAPPPVPERITGADGKSYLSRKAPVIADTRPAGIGRAAALEELAKAKRQSATFGAVVAELLRGSLAAKVKRELDAAGHATTAAKWEALADALGRVE